MNSAIILLVLLTISWTVLLFFDDFDNLVDYKFDAIHC